MRIIRSITGQRALSESWRRRGYKIGFIPTMGALHDGHLSLVRASVGHADRTVASIFVNPRQFGPREDFSRYPRNFMRDMNLLSRAQVDVVFAPQARMIYPQDFATRVEVVGPIAEILCGPHRPGHFAGVATVVAKLLNIVRPSILFLGQKDAQQVRIIQRMVRDLDFNVRVRVLPTVRHADGLAVSSRNQYLTPTQRRIAPALFAALRAGRDVIRRGESRPGPTLARMRQMLARTPELRLQYLNIVDIYTLQPVSKIRGSVLLAVAAWLGKTRLIDNLLVRTTRR